MTLRDQFVEETGWNPNKGLFFNDYALWLEARDKEHLAKIESRDRAIKAWKKEELQYIEMEKEHLAKIEEMQQTISRQMDLRADATRELATLKQSIEDAPTLTYARNQLVGALMPEPKSTGDWINYKVVEIVELKDGELWAK